MKIAEDGFKLSDVYWGTIIQTYRVGLEQPFDREEYISPQLNGKRTVYRPSCHDVGYSTVNKR